MTRLLLAITFYITCSMPAYSLLDPDTVGGIDFDDNILSQCFLVNGEEKTPTTELTITRPDCKATVECIFTGIGDDVTELAFAAGTADKKLLSFRELDSDGVATDGAAEVTLEIIGEKDGTTDSIVDLVDLNNNVFKSFFLFETVNIFDCPTGEDDLLRVKTKAKGGKGIKAKNVNINVDLNTPRLTEEEARNALNE